MLWGAGNFLPWFSAIFLSSFSTLRNAATNVAGPSGQAPPAQGAATPAGVL